MKKRLFAILLAVCMAVSMLALPASAAGLSNTAIQTAVTLGAMEPDRTGSLNAAVTRGALAKMLVGFSAYRDSAAKQGNLGTLYKDVPSSLDCAPYVRIAVQQGWMNGYTDGTFRPDNAVTLEEACTAVLKMLGYKMTDLNGAFPDAQLNKAQELGLRNQLGRARGETMNYEDCAILLYNALTANTASGGSYGSSLGFTVSNGQVDVSSVMLKNLQGPFVAGAGTQLPFAPVNVYRNDKTSSSAELNQYDVYYYSESLQTVWIYTRRAAGRITAVAPNASAPTAVTVAGTSYTLGSTVVASKVSSLNGGGVGEVVTLLLGMNNEVADVITGEEADSVFYGVVQSSSRNLVEDNGADVLQRVAIMCTDGIVRTVNVDKSLNLPKGWLVEISVTPEGENVEAISGKPLTGKVSADGTTLGSYALADDVQILDTTSEGMAGTVRPSRLSGTNLNALNVRYYTLNENGQIDRLILNDVTGDLWTYGVLDDIKNLAVNADDLKTLGTLLGGGTVKSDDTQEQIVTDLKNVLVPTTSEVLWGIVNGDILTTLWQKLTSSTGSLLSLGLRQIGTMVGEPYASVLRYVSGGATYVCYVNGSQTAFTTQVKYPVLAGGVAARQEVNGGVKAMVQLMPIKIDKVGAATVLSGSTRYEMADDTQVYLWYKGQYYHTKLTEVNADGYYLTGWYDNFGCAAGKKVRVIVAVKKD